MIDCEKIGAELQDVRGDLDRIGYELDRLENVCDDIEVKFQSLIAASRKFEADKKAAAAKVEKVPAISPAAAAKKIDKEIKLAENARLFANCFVFAGVAGFAVVFIVFFIAILSLI